MSKFGQKQLQNAGYASTYIPHHVDTAVFTPLSKERRKLEVKIDPKMFVFGMISANKDLLPRKSFGHVLLAFKRFHEAHPNSLLYIHTNPEFSGGYPLKAHVDYLGLNDCVGFPDKYKLNFDTPKSEMNMIYGTFDCLLSPSSTEGFCIPVIEAQATGTPVIVNDYTSMPELIIDGKTGFITDLSPDCQHFMPIGGYMKFPSIQSLYEKMELVYKANRPEMGVKARKFIEENYALEDIWKNKWLPFLERIEAEIYPPTLPLTIPKK
jgi:glycosyltransferase involved in cell wall biosynthesis